MNPPSEIASLLYRTNCFRCKGDTWESVGAKKALCTTCRIANRKAYGIARLMKKGGRNGSVHVYVHANTKSKY